MSEIIFEVIMEYNVEQKEDSLIKLVVVNKEENMENVIEKQ